MPKINPQNLQGSEMLFLKDYTIRHFFQVISTQPVNVNLYMKQQHKAKKGPKEQLCILSFANLQQLIFRSNFLSFSLPRAMLDHGQWFTFCKRKTLCSLFAK